jgi:hypothetical protein
MEERENLNTENVGADRGEAAGSRQGAESEKEDGGKDSGGAGREANSREENAAMKAARLRGRRDAEAALRRQYDTEISASGVVNPLTGRPFESFQEFLAFGKRVNEARIEKRAQKENRPRDEIRQEEELRAILDKRKEEEKKRGEAVANKKRQSEFLKADVKRFMREYPQVDVVKLEQNEKFKRYARGRLYKEPLAEVYTDYMEFVTDAEKAALAKADSRASRGTGAGGGASEGSLTGAQQKELESWNRLYPHMKMTAKEFKGR